MPELPEVNLYLHALRARILGRTLRSVRIRSPSLLKSFDPPIAHAHGKVVESLSRLGKRVVLGLEDGLFLVVHLMIAGRFQWRKPGAAIHRKTGHAAFDFAHGTLLLTEASSHKRASLHLVRGASALHDHDPGGIEPLEATPREFAAAMRRENRTLKRALTDPRILSGIGNAHSDEILLRARLSPVKLTSRLTDDEIERLYAAARSSLAEWSARLIDEAGDGFPAKVTAFHPGHERARQIRRALQPVRHAHSAHRVRDPRDQLLPRLPDGGTTAGRPGALAVAAPGLAAHARGSGGR